MSEILPSHDRYIDLMLMTHPQQDHMGGFPEVLKSYKVGAFLGTGRTAPIGSYAELMGGLAKRGVPYIGLEEGDRIRYGDIIIDVLSPNKSLMASDELNDTVLVLLAHDQGVRSLFMADAGSNVESLFFEI